jgi:hypothetical protein
MAHNLAPFVEAIVVPLQRPDTEHAELVNWIMPPIPQPIYQAGQYIRGDIVALRDTNRRGNPDGLLHTPNLAGVGLV